MTDLLQQLRAANPVQDADLAPSLDRAWEYIAARDTDADGPHRTRPEITPTLLSSRRRWRIAAPVVATALGAVTLLLVIGTDGTGPPRALAAWTPHPTPARRAQIAAVQSACDPTAAPLLVDTRGPVSLMVYLTPATPGSPTNDSVLCMPSLATYAWGGVSTDVAPSEITVTDISHSYMSSGGQPVPDSDFTFIYGQTGSTVTGVTLDLADGSQAQATASSGWFACWWPGDANPTAATLTTATGTTTQDLSTLAHSVKLAHRGSH